MSLLLRKLLHLSTSHRRSIGWGGSIAVHLLGAWVAWGTVVGTRPVEPPQLLGQVPGEQIELQAVWIQSRQPMPLPEPRPFESSVLVMPELAQIGPRTYTLTDSDVSQPTTEEEASVERLMRGVPPATARRDVFEQPERSTPSDDAPSTLPPPRSDAAASLEPEVRLPVPTPQPKITGGVTMPRRLDNRPPIYPAPASMQRLEGTVLLRVHLSADGSVGQLEIITSSGHPILDAAAVRAVRTWHYAPAMRGGQGVPFTFRQPVRFALREP